MYEMELEEDTSEVAYTIKIPAFSRYTDFNHSFTTEFPLIVNRFRSQWRLTILPFVTKNGCYGEDSINQDVGVILECIKCNVNLPHIEIYSKVHGRDQHEKPLTQTSSKTLKWQDNLVSRLGLKMFRLLDDDQLTAGLRFVITGSEMARAVGGIEGIAKQMGELLSSGEYSDVDILTSDGVRMPVHSAVLHCRSNLLQRVAVAKKRSHFAIATSSIGTQSPNKLFPTKFEKLNHLLVTTGTTESNPKFPRLEHLSTKIETPINSSFGSISSGYQSGTSVALSPESSQKSRNSATHMSPSSAHCKKLSMTNANSINRYSCTPNQIFIRPKRPTTPVLAKTPSTLSSHKQMSNLYRVAQQNSSCALSSKSSQTPRRTSFIKQNHTSKRVSSKSSLTPIKISPVKCSLISRRSGISKKLPSPRTPSPNKCLNTPIRVSSSSKHHLLLRRTPIGVIDTPSPRRRLYHDICENVPKEEDGVHRTLLKETAQKCTEDCKPLVTSLELNSTNDSSVINTGKTPVMTNEHFWKCRLKQREIEDFPESLSLKPEIKVSMSASVTRSLLEWIYTGECSAMDRLARALLVGGLRHDVCGLARACEYHLSVALTPMNVPEMLLLAQKYSAHLLMEAAFDYAVLQATEVTSQPLWGAVAERAPALVAEFSRRLALFSQANGNK